ncbi:hypothetical protein GCM10027034_37450 [Ramlibacter solisilvae]
MLFAGELIATKVACVTDFILRDVPRTREYARISDYPRWTESGLALFLRLLNVSAPIPELAEDAVGRITVELIDDAGGRVFIDSPGGRVLSMKGCRESAGIKAQPGWLECTLISPEALVADMRVMVSFPVSVQNAICIALAKALGCKQLTRAARRPLTSIGIRRTEKGEEYVLLRDIPALPRRYLRLYLSLPKSTRAVAATEWRAFIQALLSQSGSSWAWVAARVATRAQ